MMYQKPSPERAELWPILDRCPEIVAPLLEKIQQGHIAGRYYWPIPVGDDNACCLYGWIATLVGYRVVKPSAITPRALIEIDPDILNKNTSDSSCSPLEMAILDARPGDTPATHPGLALVERLILDWMTANGVAI